MRKIYGLLLFCSVVLGASVYGQQSPILQQNYFNHYSLQPAYTGYYKGLDVWSGYRRTMFGYNGSPSSALLNLSYRTSEKQSFGMNLQSNQTGLLKNNLFHLSYAYRVKFKADQYLSIGMSAGVAENRFDFTGVKLEDNSDFGNIANNGKTMLNLSFGAAYLSKHLEAGFGLLNIASNKVSYDYGRTVLSYQLHPAYVANASYRFDCCNNYFVKPGVIVRGQANQKPIVDVFTSLGYKKVAELIVGYRSTQVLPIVALVNLYKGVHIYYGYEVSMGDFAQVSKGGHEFGFGYRVSLNKSIDNYVSHEKELVSKNDSLKLVVKRLADTLTVKQEALVSTSQKNAALVKENTTLSAQNTTYAKEVDSLLNVIRSNNKNLVSPKIDGNKVEVETARGYYVVLESSKNRVALERDLIKWQQELEDVFIIKGGKHNWYYICMFRGETKKQALTALRNIREKYPLAWIKIQKIN